MCIEGDTFFKVDHQSLKVKGCFSDRPSFLGRTFYNIVSTKDVKRMGGTQKQTVEGATARRHPFASCLLPTSLTKPCWSLASNQNIKQVL